MPKRRIKGLTDTPPRENPAANVFLTINGQTRAAHFDQFKMDQLASTFDFLENPPNDRRARVVYHRCDETPIADPEAAIVTAVQENMLRQGAANASRLLRAARVQGEQDAARRSAPMLRSRPLPEGYIWHIRPGCVPLAVNVFEEGDIPAGAYHYAVTILDTNNNVRICSMGRCTIPYGTTTELAVAGLAVTRDRRVTLSQELPGVPPIPIGTFDARGVQIADPPELNTDTR